MDGLTYEGLRKIMSEVMRDTLGEFSFVQLRLPADSLAVRDDGTIFALRATGYWETTLYMLKEWFEVPSIVERFTGFRPGIMQTDSKDNIYFSLKPQSGGKGRVYIIPSGAEKPELFWESDRTDVFIRDIAVYLNHVLMSEQVPADTVQKWWYSDAGSEPQVIHEAPAIPSPLPHPIAGYGTGFTDGGTVVVSRIEDSQDYFKRGKFGAPMSDVVDMPAVRHILYLRKFPHTPNHLAFAACEYFMLRFRNFETWQTDTPETDTLMQVCLHVEGLLDLRGSGNYHKPWYEPNISPQGVLYQPIEHAILVSPDLGETWLKFLDLENYPGVQSVRFWRGWVLVPLQPGYWGIPDKHDAPTRTLAFKEPPKARLKELVEAWTDIIVHMHYSEIGTEETGRTIRATPNTPSPHMLIPLCCLKNHRQATIYAYNSTDQDITIRLEGTDSPIGEFGEKGSRPESRYDIATITVPAGGKKFETLTDFHPYIFPYVSASASPTEGYLLVKVHKR